MKNFFIILALIVVALSACQQNGKSGDATNYNIITLGGAITETVFALGKGDQVVAVDVTSTAPEAVNNIPKLGHISNVSMENALKFEPSLIIANNDPAGTNFFQQVKDSELPLVLVEKVNSIENTKAMIKTVGEALKEEAKANELIAQIDKDLEAVNGFQVEGQTPPKVLFLYARGSDVLMVGGKGTEADYMIELAGGINAANKFHGFKPLSPEAAIEANPDVILVFESGMQSLNGEEGVLSLPGIAETNAAKNKKVVAMDGHYLLGFGPRVAQAAKDLAEKIR